MPRYRRRRKKSRLLESVVANQIFSLGAGFAVGFGWDYILPNGDDLYNGDNFMSATVQGGIIYPAVLYAFGNHHTRARDVYLYAPAFIIGSFIGQTVNKAML